MHNHICQWCKRWWICDNTDSYLNQYDTDHDCRWHIEVACTSCLSNFEKERNNKSDARAAPKVENQKKTSKDHI
jgi:hypothetical protein